MKHIWIVVIGIALIAVGQLAEQVMPRIIYAALMLSHVSSYSSSNWDINLMGYNILCALVVVLGIVAVVFERK